MVGGLQSVSFPVQAVGDPAPIPVTFFVCGPDPAKQPTYPGQTGHWLCSADCQLWHPYSALVSLGYSAFQMFHQLPGQVGLRPSLRSGPDHDLAHMPGRVQTGSQGWQISSFKDPDQETYTLTPLPCRRHHWLGSTHEQNCQLGSLSGCCRSAMELSLPWPQCQGSHQPLPTSPSQSDSQ